MNAAARACVWSISAVVRLGTSKGEAKQAVHDTGKLKTLIRLRSMTVCLPNVTQSMSYRAEWLRIASNIQCHANRSTKALRPQQDTRLALLKVTPAWLEQYVGRKYEHRATLFEVIRRSSNSRQWSSLNDNRFESFKPHEVLSRVQLSMFPLQRFLLYSYVFK